MWEASMVFLSLPKAHSEVITEEGYFTFYRNWNVKAKNFSRWRGNEKRVQENAEETKQVSEKSFSWEAIKKNISEKSIHLHWFYSISFYTILQPTISTFFRVWKQFLPLRFIWSSRKIAFIEQKWEHLLQYSIFHSNVKMLNFTPTIQTQKFKHNWKRKRNNPIIPLSRFFQNFTHVLKSAFINRIPFQHTT